jgi:hypothetical protein
MQTVISPSEIYSGEAQAFSHADMPLTRIVRIASQSPVLKKYYHVHSIGVWWALNDFRGPIAGFSRVESVKILAMIATTSVTKSFTSSSSTDFNQPW